MVEDIKGTEISESVIFSVSEVTFHIKQVMETQIEALYIVGEISNFVKHGSGHIYFNLKDENAVIRCAFFRNQNYQLDFLPQDGDQVVCFGKISVFEKSGQYQLILQNMFPYGKGALQQKFELLKLKLKAEGLFNKEHKKPLPKYPDTIGIITSPTGAALQDILNILKRRYPCKVVVYPALMQGTESPGQVIKGLAYFNVCNQVDLIIIARGGGSQEDLFCFNDESLAREIYASKLPVVSAIGHEIDFTISDFVADLRAPTPSAAAELTTPDKLEVQAALSGFADSYNHLISNKLLRLRNSAQHAQIILMHFKPEKIWQSFQQRFDEAVTGLYGINEKLARFNNNLNHSQALFCNEMSNSHKRIVILSGYKLKIADSQLKYVMKDHFQRTHYRLDLADNSLEDLSPHKVLERGYSIIRKSGKAINTVKNMKAGDELEVLVSDGQAKVKVESTEKGGVK